MTNQEIYDRIKELFANDKSVNFVYFSIEGDILYFQRQMHNEKFTNTVSGLIEKVFTKIIGSQSTTKTSLNHSIIDIFRTCQSVEFVMVSIDGKADIVCKDLHFFQIMKLFNSWLSLFENLDKSDDEILI